MSTWWDTGQPDMTDEPLVMEGRLCDGCQRASCPEHCPFQPVGNQPKEQKP